MYVLTMGGADLVPSEHSLTYMQARSLSQNGLRHRFSVAPPREARIQGTRNEKWETRSTNEDERETRGTNEGGMRNGKREAQMRTNGKREAQMRANVETRNGKRECTSGPPYFSALVSLWYI